MTAEPPYAPAVDALLAKLDLDAKASLLSGRDMWTLPPVPEIGLGAMVMSDGPVGVRGVRWTAADPSLALPSPTALAATWDPQLARRAGHALAREAHRKGVHVLLAPTVNLHRSPLGGRHFEAYSEDPLLTGAIGAGYVRGVQEGGIGTTVKHFVANDAETDRFTVDNKVSDRALRELYLRPFEMINESAHPWGVMTAYNSVNGPTMTEHRHLVQDVLRGEWGFDGINVSDWMAARNTERALAGGLDIAMPGPRTIYGAALAAAVREGRADERDVDAAVRRVLLLAARVGLLDGVEPAVPADRRPTPEDGKAVAREIARRSFVLVRNTVVRAAVEQDGTVQDGAATPYGEPVLPLRRDTRVALLGAAARDARVLGGGSATVFPEHVVSPLEGLREALPGLTYAVGADPNDELVVAGDSFTLRAVCRDAEGRELGGEPLPSGQVQWLGDLPEGVDHDELHTVEITGSFTPRESGTHHFGTRGVGAFRLEVAGRELFDGSQGLDSGDPFEALFGTPVERGTAELSAGEPVSVSLTYTVVKSEAIPLPAVLCALTHLGPRRDPDELIAEAASAASAAKAAVVVVATTERVESEGFDRTSLALPGRQDELVRAVAAANPRTVVIVNAGAPVQMPWRDDVAAVLLGWFPGEQAGAALADVLLGDHEPGGRLPTTWPAALEDAPVRQVVPQNGELPYTEDVFIGYRAWQRAGTEPAYPFGHGLGYTDWEYEEAAVTPAAPGGGELATVTVRVRNTGARTGREVVQIYLAPQNGNAQNGSSQGAPQNGHPADSPSPERPARWLAGFATVEAEPGETATVEVRIPRRAAEVWDESLHGGTGGWRLVGGNYTVEAARSVADPRATATLTVR